MPELAPVERPVMHTQELAKAPDIREQRNPRGAESLIQKIDELGGVQTSDPDASIRAIAALPLQDKSNSSPTEISQSFALIQPETLPTVDEPAYEIESVRPEARVTNAATVENAAYRLTIQTLKEKIVHEKNPEESARLSQEMGNLVADYLPQLPADRASTFITEFNTAHPGVLKSQEFRLLQSMNDTLITVDASGNLHELGVTQDNAKGVLDEVKRQDELIRGKSYELRKELLKRSNGDITTYEAYTYATEIPQGGALDVFLDNPENWVPERRALGQQIVDEEFAKAIALSARLGDPEPTIYALRGNTAAGKTTATKSDVLFRKALDENGQPTGAINPDTYKSELKAAEAVGEKQSIGHQQAHEEGSMLARKIAKRIADSESSMVIDKRMNKTKNITELIATAAEHRKGVRILDVDVPLETSLVRVLNRDIGGQDPTVPFDAVAEGFEGIRKNRASLLEQVIANPNIKDYVLYVADESGTSIKAAQKVNGEFTVIAGQEEAFKQATSPDTAAMVDNMAHTVIDEAYIASVLSRTSESFQSKVRASLERYSGATLKQALDLHAKKLNEG